MNADFSFSLTMRYSGAQVIVGRRELSLDSGNDNGEVDWHVAGLGDFQPEVAVLVGCVRVAMCCQHGKTVS